MNSESWKLAEQILPATYVKQANDATRSRENTIRQLLQHVSNNKNCYYLTVNNKIFFQKKLPEEGWDDSTIEKFLKELSDMDSNNFPSNCGVGEREGRFASSI